MEFEWLWNIIFWVKIHLSFVCLFRKRSKWKRVEQREYLLGKGIGSDYWLFPWKFVWTEGGSVIALLSSTRSLSEKWPYWGWSSGFLSRGNRFLRFFRPLFNYTHNWSLAKGKWKTDSGNKCCNQTVSEASIRPLCRRAPRSARAAAASVFAGVPSSFCPTCGAGRRPSKSMTSSSTGRWTNGPDPSLRVRHLPPFYELI